jgi:cadmium resistance protein CadD (predicted permease)
VSSSLEAIAIGVTVFVLTNIDDVFLLTAFFADGRVRARAIVSGQLLDIGALVAASALAALTALVIPRAWIALLGLAPLALGLRLLRRPAAAPSPATHLIGARIRRYGIAVLPLVLIGLGLYILRDAMPLFT